MLIFVYGVVCYSLFLAAFLYLVGFVGNFGVPRSIDAGIAGPIWLAVLVDMGLLMLFGLQHSIMARPRFKVWFTRVVPAAAERSTFVLATCVVLALTYWQWRTIEGGLWDIETGWVRALLTGVSLAGWGTVVYSTFLINHFDLFGLRQVFLHLRQRRYTRVAFKQPWLYRLVRNPLMLGFLIAFWSAPTMSWGRLLFAAGMTGYILVGVYFEERDLARHLGEPYRRYRARTPMLLPIGRRGANEPEVAGTAAAT